MGSLQLRPSSASRADEKTEFDLESLLQTYTDSIHEDHGGSNQIMMSPSYKAAQRSAWSRSPQISRTSSARSFASMRRCKQATRLSSGKLVETLPRGSLDESMRQLQVPNPLTPPRFGSKSSGPLHSPFGSNATSPTTSPKLKIPISPAQVGRCIGKQIGLQNNASSPSIDLMGSITEEEADLPKRIDREVDLVASLSPCAPVDREAMLGRLLRVPDEIECQNCLLMLPNHVRWKVYNFCFPNEPRKISLSPEFATRDLFPSGFFASPWVVLEPVMGGMAAFRSLRRDLITYFWTEYTFHITLSPFTGPAFSPLSHVWVLKYLHLIQWLTIEVDLTKFYAFYTNTTFDRRVDKIGGMFETLVAGLQNRPHHVAIEELHIMCRRYAGERPNLQASHREYVKKYNTIYPDGIWTIYDTVGELRGILRRARISGLPLEQTTSLLCLLFGDGDRNPRYIMPNKSPWPPQPHRHYGPLPPRMAPNPSASSPDLRKTLHKSQSAAEELENGLLKNSSSPSPTPPLTVTECGSRRSSISSIISNGTTRIPGNDTFGMIVPDENLVAEANNTFGKFNSGEKLAVGGLFTLDESPRILPPADTTTRAQDPSVIPSKAIEKIPDVSGKADPAVTTPCSSRMCPITGIGKVTAATPRHVSSPCVNGSTSPSVLSSFENYHPSEHQDLGSTKYMSPSTDSLHSSSDDSLQASTPNSFGRFLNGRSSNTSPYLKPLSQRRLFSGQTLSNLDLPARVSSQTQRKNFSDLDLPARVSNRVASAGVSGLGLNLPSRIPVPNSGSSRFTVRSSSLPNPPLANEANADDLKFLQALNDANESNTQNPAFLRAVTGLRCSVGSGSSVSGRADARSSSSRPATSAGSLPHASAPCINLPPAAAPMKMAKHDGRHTNRQNGTVEEVKKKRKGLLGLTSNIFKRYRKTSV